MRTTKIITEGDVIRMLKQHFDPIICTYCGKEISVTRNFKRMLTGIEPIEFIQPMSGKPKVFHKDCFKEYLKKGF